MYTKYFGPRNQIWFRNHRSGQPCTRGIEGRQNVQNLCDVSHPEPGTYEGHEASNQSSLKTQ